MLEQKTIITNALNKIKHSNVLKQKSSYNVVLQKQQKKCYVQIYCTGNILSCNIYKILDTVFLKIQYKINNIKLRSTPPQLMIQYNEYSIILYSTVNDAQNKDQHLLYCDLISFTIVLS